MEIYNPWCENRQLYSDTIDFFVSVQCIGYTMSDDRGLLPRETQSNNIRMVYAFNMLNYEM